MRVPKRIWVFLIALQTAAGLAASDRRELSPGLVYEHRVLEGPLSIHILEVDPKHFEIFPARALNNGLGRETVSSIGSRKGAVAAINGGFFKIGGRYDGDPTGVLKIAGEWFSDTAVKRAAIGWSDGGRKVGIGRLRAECSLHVGEVQLPVSGINRTRGRSEAILYNSSFHRSTLTNPNGTEAIFLNDRLIKIIKGGDSQIPPGGFVYSLGPGTDSSLLESLSGDHAARVNCRVSDHSPSTTDSWESFEHVVGGTPILLIDGNPVESLEEENVRERFIEDRHPRTAVGVREDGTWLMVVVDGRQPQLSIGMTLAELVGLMRSLGCHYAVNLDGGGSSAFFLDGKVRNSPSGFSVERPVSDAILVRPRK